MKPISESQNIIPVSKAALVIKMCIHSTLTFDNNSLREFLILSKQTTDYFDELEVFSINYGLILSDLFG